MIEHEELFEEVDLGAGDDDNGDPIVFDVTAHILIDPSDASEWHYDSFVIKYTATDQTYTSTEIVDIAICWGVSDQKHRLACQDRMKARAEQVIAGIHKIIAKWEMDNRIYEVHKEYHQTKGYTI